MTGRGPERTVFLPEAEEAASLVDENRAAVADESGVGDHEEGPLPAPRLFFEGSHRRNAGDVEQGHDEEGIGGKRCEERRKRRSEPCLTGTEEGAEGPHNHFLGQEAKEKGYLITEDWNQWLTDTGLHNAVINLPNLSNEDLVEFCDYARRKYYTHPNYLFRKIGQSLTDFDELKRNWIGFKSLVKYLIKGSYSK